MLHHHRKSTLSRETSSSSSHSARSSVNRKRSHKAPRHSRSHRHYTRDGEDRVKRDAEEGISVGKRIYMTVEKLENPVKKLGKLVLWSAPLILAGLEVRHEWHHHAHKRRMMGKEYEKAHFESQLQRNTDGKKEGTAIDGAKVQEAAQRKDEEAHASPSEEVHILPYPSQAEDRSHRSRGCPPRRDLEGRQPYLLPTVAPQTPVRDAWETRRPRIRVKPPGYRDVSFPRGRSWSESVYEYRQW